ncbi:MULTISPECIES: hypothetical protein [unclassified Nocardioides]|uniref:hypothetical protein n=1 Tax=unclassified Nocardioides TaxID=2615069 RepID=UPI003612473B
MLNVATPMVTEAARYVLGFSIAACFAALGVGAMIWMAGRHDSSPQAASRGMLGVLVALVALTLVLLLALIYAL